MSIEKLNEIDFEREHSIERGIAFLETQQEKGHFPSDIGTSRDMSDRQRSPDEVFSTIVVADTALTDNNSSISNEVLQWIDSAKKDGSLYSFFIESNEYPPDADTNSLAYSLLIKAGIDCKQQANETLDSILKHTSPEGITQVWLSETRKNRTDAVVCANTLYLSHLLERGDETKDTEAWLMQQLKTNDHESGTRYYESPDALLYFAARLIKFPEVTPELAALVSDKLQQRIGSSKNALDLAMRVSVATELGFDNSDEAELLSRMQEPDGGWPTDALFNYGNKKGYFGSRALTTAFVIRALKSKGVS